MKRIINNIQGMTVAKPKKCDKCKRENSNCVKLYVTGIGQMCVVDKTE